MHTNTFRKALIATGLAALTASPALAILPLAKGELFVTADARVEFDNNIYTNANEIYDTILFVTPGVSYTRKAGLLKLNTSAGLEVQRFADNTRHNSENGRFNGDLTWANEEGKSDGKLVVGANRLAFANAEVNDRVVNDTYTLNGEFAHWMTEKFGFRVATDNSEQRSVVGGYSDITKNQFGGDFRYQVSPKLEALAGYSYRHTESEKDAVVNSNIKANDNLFSLGLKGELTSKLTGEVRGGFVTRDVNGKFNRSENAPFAKVALAWAAAEKTTINFVVKKDFDVSQADQSANKFDVTLVATQQLVEKVSVTGMLNYMHGNYVGGTARKDDSYMGRVMLNYKLTELMTAQAYVSTSETDSTTALSEYNRTTVGLQFTAKF